MALQRWRSHSRKNYGYERETATGEEEELEDVHLLLWDDDEDDEDAAWTQIWRKEPSQVWVDHPKQQKQTLQAWISHLRALLAPLFSNKLNLEGIVGFVAAVTTTLRSVFLDLRTCFQLWPHKSSVGQGSC